MAAMVSCRAFHTLRNPNPFSAILHYTWPLSIKQSCAGRFPLPISLTSTHTSYSGFFLNPKFQYQEGFLYSDSIRSGVMKVIERLAPDVTFAIEATREVAQFRGKIGRFGDLTTQTAVGIMNPAHALKGESDVLLQRIGDKNSLEAVKQIFELGKRASSRREIFHTDFLTPPVLKEAMLVLEKVSDVKAVAQGGYPQAERCRISIGHSEVMETVPDTVAALSITGNFGFESYSHGDFLGSILGTGVAREKLGDIILQGEKGAHVLVVPELVDFLLSSLQMVGNVPVSCVKIPLLALEFEPPRTKSFKSIEASLRVDALASAGFKISRSKLVDLISSGDVRVNWSPVTKNGAMLKTGDIVSISGKGRLKIGEITPTKKGKFAVELIRYL